MHDGHFFTRGMGLLVVPNCQAIQRFLPLCCNVDLLNVIVNSLTVPNVNVNVFVNLLTVLNVNVIVNSLTVGRLNVFNVIVNSLTALTGYPWRALPEGASGRIPTSAGGRGAPRAPDPLDAGVPGTMFPVLLICM